MKKKLIDQKIIESAARHITMLAAANEIGIPYNTFIRRAKNLGVYKPNQGGKGTSKPYKGGNAIPLSEILEGKHPQYQTFKLKHRLYENGLKENKCEKCGTDKWNNKDIQCQLEHVDGDKTNHRLLNLEILCPNCHSQTETYCGKNKGKNKIA